MSIPLSVILKQLESAPESIVPILSALHYDKTILNNISKPDSRHLVSRALNLARSPVEYNKWCGTNLIRVLGANYALLASGGITMLSQLVKNLENYNETINIKILTSTVEAIDYLCKQIRGKPTLTREILTPNLSSIISLYLEKLHYSPLLIINSLSTLVKYHPTTFRPFANKLGSRLVTFLNTANFVSYPEALKTAIFKTLAVLPVVEKADPEVKWESNVRNLIKEVVSVLSIYNEFLTISDDADLVKLIQKLPSFDPDSSANDRILSTMDIDVNQPESVFQISTRIEILVGLLQAYMTTETPFSVRIPLGLLVTLNEVITSINLKFLSFKFDVRDDNLRALIKSTTALNHKHSVRFMTALATIFKGNMLPHLSNILSFLEIVIPFKNKEIDYNGLLSHEELALELLTCVETYLNLVANLGDNSQLLRFVDIALLLVEPRSNESHAGPESKDHKVQGNGKKQKKKKNNDAVALSDLLSHQHLFTEKISTTTVKVVRSFLGAIITKVSLPPTQHYKIMRYLILETVSAKFYSHENKVPQELRQLLINSVLYPGFEKISLLPIVTSLLPDDPLLSVFINPRFPPLPAYIKKPEMGFEREIAREEVEEEEEEGKDEQDQKRRKISDPADISGEPANIGGGEGEAEVPVASTTFTPVEQEKIFVTREVDQNDVMQFAKDEPQVVTETVQSTTVTETTVPTAAASRPSAETSAAADDDSDFEIPEIDIDSDEE